MELPGKKIIQAVLYILLKISQAMALGVLKNGSVGGLLQIIPESACQRMVAIPRYVTTKIYITIHLLLNWL